jgi:hypothetical protein
LIPKLHENKFPNKPRKRNIKEVEAKGEIEEKKICRWIHLESGGKEESCIRSYSESRRREENNRREGCN